MPCSKEGIPVKKLVLLTALALSTNAFAQMPNPDPMSAFRTMLDIVDIGKANEQTVQTAASAFHCSIKTEHNGQRLLVDDKGNGCLGANQASVSFLGANHVSDSFYLIWEFKERKDFEAVQSSVEKGLRNMYGSGGQFNPGKIFDDGFRYRTKIPGQWVFFFWSTFGDYVKIEVVNEAVEDKGGSVKENISELMAKFPRGSGKLSDVEPLAESWGCMVKDSGHPKWMTMSSRANKNCRGMNIFFERNPENQEVFTGLRFNPAVPGEKVVTEYEQVLSEMYGKPEEFDMPIHEEPTLVYKADDIGIVLNHVELQGEPSVDVFVGPYYNAVNSIKQTIETVKEKERIEKEKDAERERKRKERMKERFKSSKESTPTDTSAPFTQKALPKDNSEPFTQK